MNVREALTAVVQAYNSTLTAYGSQHVTTAASHALRRTIDNAALVLAKPDTPDPELVELRAYKARMERVYELKFPKEG